MLQFIMEKNLLLYLLAASCLIGVTSQFLLGQIYEKLIKNTKNHGEAGDHFLQQLRQRFHYCTHLNEKVGDVSALIRKNLMEYRSLGLNLHQWKRLGVQCMIVSLLCAAGGTLYLCRDSQQFIWNQIYFWSGIGAALLIAAAYGITDTGYKRNNLEVQLTDYLENSGAVRNYTEPEEAAEEDAETSRPKAPIVSVAQGRKERRKAKNEAAALTRAQKEKRELKENLARMKTGMQETAAEREHGPERPAERSRGSELLRQMDPKDQERILREVLQEFLS